jgi:pyruvate,water dikinase
MVKIIKGVVANKGKVKGRAMIVRGPKDFKKFAAGDILVARLTDPSYAAVIIKAAAIVTDRGGITSHPAIIAREFDLPCIVGTKNASTIIKNGELIEVNANEGFVKIIR